MIWFIILLHCIIGFLCWRFALEKLIYPGEGEISLGSDDKTACIIMTLLGFVSVSFVVIFMIIGHCETFTIKKRWFGSFNRRF